MATANQRLAIYIAPRGTKTGDAIHVFQRGSIQMVRDVSMDPAGNAWVANNWNNVDAA